MPNAPLFADIELGRRIESGWVWTAVESARVYGENQTEREVAAERIGLGGATYFGPGSPLSQAMGFGLDGPVGDDLLDRLEGFYDQRGNATSIEVASLADPAFLPKLSARGYRIAEQTHMLARSLVDPTPTQPGERDEKAAAIVVERVGGPERLDAWSRVVLGGFFEGEGAPPPEIAEVMTALISAPGSSAWLASLHDGGASIPAAGASLLVHGGVGLLAGDATLPRYRGRGAQASLILARLSAAIEAGCDLAAVCVNPGSASQRNYERLGFRLIHARTLMVRDPSPNARASSTSPP